MSGQLRIASWNIGSGNHSVGEWDGPRLKLVADRIAAFRPNVILLQEVERANPKGVADIQRAIRRRLRDRGIDTQSRFALSQHPMHIPHRLGKSTFTSLPSSENKAPKVGRHGARVQRLVVDVGGQPVRIYHVHLRAGDADLEALVKHIRLRQRGDEEPMPFVVAGDFNTRRTSDKYSELVESLSLDNGSEGQVTVNHIARPDIANPPAIDHILHSQWDGWRTLGGYCHASSEVPPLSDHFAVFAAFELLDG